MHSVLLKQLKITWIWGIKRKIGEGINPSFINGDAAEAETKARGETHPPRNPEGRELVFPPDPMLSDGNGGPPPAGPQIWRARRRRTTLPFPRSGSRQRTPRHASPTAGRRRRRRPPPKLASSLPPPRLLLAARRRPLALRVGACVRA